VAVNFFLWRREVEEHGIEEVRKIPGYHDEPLQGKLKGIVRSVRLGQGYRAFYRIREGKVKCVFVEEVNLHDYKEIERLFGL
jgi:proteic killer suppression protein